MPTKLTEEEAKTALSGLDRERCKWRRFELVTEDIEQVLELNALLEKAALTHRELAVIVASLRVRPGFCLEDFGT